MNDLVCYSAIITINNNQYLGIRIKNVKVDNTNRKYTFLV